MSFGSSSTRFTPAITASSEEPPAFRTSIAFSVAFNPLPLEITIGRTPGAVAPPAAGGAAEGGGVLPGLRDSPFAANDPAAITPAPSPERMMNSLLFMASWPSLVCRVRRPSASSYRKSATGNEPNPGDAASDLALPAPTRHSMRGAIDWSDWRLYGSFRDSQETTVGGSGRGDPLVGGDPLPACGPGDTSRLSDGRMRRRDRRIVRR